MSAAQHAAESKAKLRSRFGQLLSNSSTDDADATPKQAEPKTQPKPRSASRPRRETSTSAQRQAAGPKRRQRGAQQAQRPAEQAQPMPIAQAGTETTRPKRLMVPLSVDEDLALKNLRVSDGIPAAARLRAMLQLYREDDRIRRKVDATAKRMR